MAEVQKQREKELMVNRRLAKELQFLKEREDKNRREKEVRRRRSSSSSSRRSITGLVTFWSLCRSLIRR